MCAYCKSKILISNENRLIVGITGACVYSAQFCILIPYCSCFEQSIVLN